MRAMTMPMTAMAPALPRRLPLRRIALGLAWAAAISLSALIILNTLPYFTFSTRIAFLVEKGAIVFDKIWRSSFYVHLAGGMICMAAGPFLFWPLLLRRAPALHRVIGRIYGFSVLGWGAPTGLYLSFSAKGGWVGTSSFFILSLLWGGTTAAGVWTILKKRPVEHRRWMIRSYAYTLSAVFFRLFHVAGYCAGLSDDINYGISLWLSLVASAVLGQLWVRSTLTHELKGALA